MLDEGIRLLCFSGTGFIDELSALADETETVQLIGLEWLYGGM